MTKKNSHPVYGLFKAAARLFCPAFRVTGLENVSRSAPSVFVCNHLRSHGPIVMELRFPIRFRPWVIHDVMYPISCRKYLEKDFITNELHLKRPFSGWLAYIIEPFCIRLMKAVEAIPVYRNDIRIFTTFSISVKTILQGNNIVIFPEVKEKYYSEHINDFYRGFVFIARKYYKETRKVINFHPVYIDLKEKAINIGKPDMLDNNCDYNTEKELLVDRLRDSIDMMAGASMK